MLSTTSGNGTLRKGPAAQAQRCDACAVTLRSQRRRSDVNTEQSESVPEPVPESCGNKNQYDGIKKANWGLFKIQ